MSTIPDGVVQIRRSLCAECASKADDPCASCDHGRWGRYTSKGCDDVGLGDRIAAVATPIARVLGMGCIDPTTQELKPDSGCAKTKQNLNQGMSLADAIFDRFWPEKPE